MGSTLTGCLRFPHFSVRIGLIIHSPTSIVRGSTGGDDPRQPLGNPRGTGRAICGDAGVGRAPGRDARRILLWRARVGSEIGGEGQCRQWIVGYVARGDNRRGGNPQNFPDTTHALMNMRDHSAHCILTIYSFDLIIIDWLTFLPYDHRIHARDRSSR